MPSNKIISKIRTDYGAKTLDVSEVQAKPIDQFSLWFAETLEAEVAEPNAMTIATVDALGRPSARIVLLKGFDENGFVFFTNYHSRKGQNINQNPNVSVVFFWRELERQVRIEGLTTKISEKDSEIYFQSRPKSSQIGAWASPQSQVIKSRDVLENKVLDIQTQYKNEDILPLPTNWGGYLIRPRLVEFWQGRSSRLHDRICYQLKDEKWVVERLAP